MTLLTILPDGRKIATKIVEASNTGTATADITVFAVIDEVNMIDHGLEGVIGVVLLDAKNYGAHVVSVSRNVVEVVVRSVPGGETSKVKVTVIGT